MGAGPGAGRGWARSERCSAQGPPAHLRRRRALSDTEEEQSAAPRWGAPTSPGLMNIGVRGRGLCGTGAWIESREAQGHVRGHSCMATTPQRGGTPGAQGRLWIWGERRAIEARAWQTVAPQRPGQSLTVLGRHSLWHASGYLKSGPKRRTRKGGE